MKKKFNTTIVDGFRVEGQCRNESFYVRFSDEDIEAMALFAFDMGYSLEPEIMDTDPKHPVRFKIISKADPASYGWITAVIEKIDGDWQESFLYGFYRHGSFRNKYPVTFNIQSRQMRGVIKRKAEKNPRQRVYFRTLFGILDLEPDGSPLDFIFSWLSGCKIQRV